MMGEPRTEMIRVVVVDDSALMLRMITAGLEAEGDISVVGQARNPLEARDIIKAVDPDVVTLDVEMPGMNGLEFLEKIMSLRPMPVIMVSTLTTAGTDVTLNALHIGAVDAVAKPCGRGGLSRFGNELRQKVRTARSATVRKRVVAVATGTARAAVGTAGASACPASSPASGTKLIAIGASTGGVGAISTLLSGLTATAPPIVITQHMPPRFLERFAGRLNDEFQFDCRIAQTGETLRAGQIRVAPGDQHLCVTRVGGVLQTRLDADSGPISGHVPSVDVLFNSVCTSVRGAAVGVILTGMGRDGAAGLKALRNAGALCLGQSEESCVVYGMPKAARALDAVDEELDLTQLADRICQFLNAPTDKKRA